MATSVLHKPKRLWSPIDVSKTNMDKFRRLVNQKHGLNLQNYQQLHMWSINDKTAGDFWVDLFEYQGLNPGVVPQKSTNTSSSVMYPPPKWFPGVTLNFAEHILQSKPRDEVAIYTTTEGAEEIISVTWGEIWDGVEEVADAMKSVGVQKGDRVAAIISNCLETIICCLATLSLGALWSTSSPDMGVKGIMDRLNQIKPKLVFFETSVQYNCKLRDLMEKNLECIEGLRNIPEFNLAILIPRKVSYSPQPDSRTTTWKGFLSKSIGGKLIFKQLPFDHPGFIVYSSGTTGAPKCIVHSACGMLIQIKKDYMLHLDVRPGDTIYQYTTTGWIMWAMVLCGLSYGGKVVIYDGSPLVPDATVTLRLIEKLKITLFGTSARFLSDLKAMNVKPREFIDLSSLRTVSSTGSVLNADVCEWFYDSAFPKTTHLVSGSGGTDLACSLVNGDPTSSLYSGEIQVAALGMAVDILDSSTDEVRSIKSTGEAGELVCRQPFPSEPAMFWGENGEQKYRDAYFERYGIRTWHQGDFVSSSPFTGGYLMLGRSDGVLNPSGVRFGSAEIYNVTTQFPEFEETLCVGQRRPHDTDETVLLFVKMNSQSSFTPRLAESVKAAIRSELSARHVPKYIFAVPEIPYTINGKKIELAVKQIVSGKKVTPSGAVANPHALQYFQRFYDVEKVHSPERAKL